MPDHDIGVAFLDLAIENAFRQSDQLFRFAIKLLIASSLHLPQRPARRRGSISSEEILALIESTTVFSRHVDKLTAGGQLIGVGLSMSCELRIPLQRRIANRFSLFVVKLQACFLLSFWDPRGRQCLRLSEE